jgi:Lrp/AsnC family transcriptional regulator for asnA, asnC and gidA
MELNPLPQWTPAADHQEGAGSTQKDLSNVDLRILRLLAADGRLSHREIARRIGMSPGTVSQRVERLEQLGVIRGYHASIDPALLGFRAEAFIGLQVTQGGTAVETMEQLYAIPEVRSVSLVTGQWDFVVEIQVRDQEHLREVLLDELWRLPIFRHSETMIILQRVQRQASWFAPDQKSSQSPP